MLKIYGKTCCFLGHRKIVESEELKQSLIQKIKELILNEGVDTFLFGSKSRFNDLCYELVTGIKKDFSHIKRIYVRAEYPFINEEYKAYLSELYEETYFPETVLGAARACYIKRNREMIDKSEFCIIYCEDSCVPESRKSGTKTALEYAKKRGKKIYLFP